MINGDTARAFCEGAAGSGALGCADVPGGAVAFEGGAKSGVRISCSWGTGIVVTTIVNSDNPCEPGIGKMSFLGFVLSLIGSVREGENVVATRSTGGFSGASFH